MHLGAGERRVGASAALGVGPNGLRLERIGVGAVLGRVGDGQQRGIGGVLQLGVRLGQAHVVERRPAISSRTTELTAKVMAIEHADFDGIERLALVTGAEIASLAEEGKLVTTGGRVLAVTALGATVAEAAERSREASARIRFEGRTFRRDIGWREYDRG